MRSAINSGLFLLAFLAVLLSSVAQASIDWSFTAKQPRSTCATGLSTGQQSWNGNLYGSRPYLCTGSAGNCKYEAGTTLCYTDDGLCTGKFYSTGETCTEEEGTQGDKMYAGEDNSDDWQDDTDSGDGGDSGDITDGLENYEDKTVCSINSSGTSVVCTNNNAYTNKLIYNSNALTREYTEKTTSQIKSDLNIKYNALKKASWNEFERKYNKCQYN